MAIISVNNKDFFQLKLRQQRENSYIKPIVDTPKIAKDQDGILKYWCTNKMAVFSNGLSSDGILKQLLS